jgi:hypothetical protein
MTTLKSLLQSTEKFHKDVDHYKNFQWHRRKCYDNHVEDFSSINYTAETIYALSMTLKQTSPYLLWKEKSAKIFHGWIINFSILRYSYTSTLFKKCWELPTPHFRFQRIGFKPSIRDMGAVNWRKFHDSFSLIILKYLAFLWHLIKRRCEIFYLCILALFFNK